MTLLTNTAPKNLFTLHSVIMTASIGAFAGCASTTTTPLYSDSAPTDKTIQHEAPTTTALTPSDKIVDKVTHNITASLIAPAPQSNSSPLLVQTKEQNNKETTAVTTMVLENTNLTTNTELLAKGINTQAIEKKEATLPLVNTDQLMLDKLIRPKKRVFHFSSNQQSLRHEDIKILKQHARYLLQNPTLSMNINGHTDARGNDSYNLKLSEKRAEEVAQQLEKMGVNKSRLHILAWGESYPVTSVKHYAENRRIELEYSIKNYAANDSATSDIH